MRSLLLPSALYALLVAAASGQASQNPARSEPFDELSGPQLTTQSEALLKEAKASPSGIASVTLKTYPRHFTMLTVRVKSGGAEQHDHFADIFVVLDGEATEVIGGKIPNSSSAKPGEVRGARVEGGVDHPMHKGDIVHIAPGTPHQTLVAPGKTFTYFVIKIEE
jgi:mannose-6-phosphate isomerase-like protein (cupin superfamily)